MPDEITVVEKSSNSIVAWTELALKSVCYVYSHPITLCDAFSDSYV